MNLRDLARTSSAPDRPYFEFDREERHLAGILFHILNYSGYVERLLKTVPAPWSWRRNEKEFGIYLEYSYPRDLWHALQLAKGDSESNRRKRDAVLAMLQKRGFAAQKLSSLKSASVKEFNVFFIGHAGASSEYIQSPANWRLKCLSENLADSHDLFVACEIKWAFRVKPDIVVHTDNQHALCIELKLEAGEGSYPASSAEKQILTDRGLFAAGRTKSFPIYQRDLQKFLMKELLGLDCCFRFITQSRTSEPDHVFWGDFLDSLKPLPDDLPLYMRVALENAQQLAIAPRIPAEDVDATEE